MTKRAWQAWHAFHWLLFATGIAAPQVVLVALGLSILELFVINVGVGGLFAFFYVRARRELDGRKRLKL